VPQGATINQILDKLEKEKIIKSAFVAKIYLKLANFKGQIQAGDFKLNPKDDLNSVISVLQKGTLDFWVTIPEGLRAEQIFEKIKEARSSRGIQDPFKIEIYKQNEGYLFPDTYLIPKNASDENVVSILRNNFYTRIESINVQNCQSGNVQSETCMIDLANGDKISLNNLIILASLVEREARNAGERSIIASIIYKRWMANWPLQIDATVQYAIGTPEAWWKKDLTFADLKVDSPYNTYLIKGLPPAPICNPGIAAIEAVVNQKLTDYWFYSTGTDGVTRYSVTLERHNANVDKFIKK
jgi:UPF0755 protein